MAMKDIQWIVRFFRGPGIIHSDGFGQFHGSAHWKRRQAAAAPTNKKKEKNEMKFSLIYAVAACCPAGTLLTQIVF